jgi:hypothetical protein
MKTGLDLSFGLNQCANALGAQHLAHHPSILEDADRLEVGAVGSLCRFLRPRAAATKGCLLTTICALSHITRSFPR